MTRAARIAFFVVICFISGAGLLILAPWLKEGFSWGEIPFVAGGAVAFIAIGVLWWLACGRSLRKASVGLAILFVPTCTYTGISAKFVEARLQGPRLAAQISIRDYREVPIEWPGFDGPVGLTITLDLVHPPGAEGVINPPQLRMGPTVPVPPDDLTWVTGDDAGYFNDRRLSHKVGRLALLKAVLFQKVYEERFASRRLDPSGVTPLVYHLHPGTIVSLESEKQLCLEPRSRGIRECARDERASSGCSRRGSLRVTDPTYHRGVDLTALWFVAGPHDMIVDVSALLTRTLRERSRAQGRPEAWQAMHERLEPEGLARAGFSLCDPDKVRHSSTRTCFCRD